MSLLPDAPSASHDVSFLMPGQSETALGRRIVYYLVITALGLVLGLAVTRVESVLIFGFIAGCVFLVVVAKWPHLGLAIYLFVFLLRPGETYPALAPLRLERVVGILTLTSWIWTQLTTYGRVTVDSSRQTRLLLWLILASLLSVPLAYWRLGAWNGFIDFTKLLIFYILIVHLTNTRKTYRLFVYLYCSMIAYIAFLSVRNYWLGSFLRAQGIDRAIGATSAGGGVNALGITMATSFPLFLQLGLHKPLGRRRWIFLTGALFLAYTLVITGSRSAFLGFLAGIVVLWWHSKHRLVLGVVGGALLVGAFFALPEQYQGRYATIASSATGDDLDGSSQERLKVWTKGLKMFADRPLTGVGLDCFGTANAMAYSSGRASWLNSHSLYIQVAAEMGIIGLAAFMSFLTQLVRLNRRTSRLLTAGAGGLGFERVVLDGIFAGTIVLLFTGIFGHSLQRPTWYIYAALGVSTWRAYQLGGASPNVLVSKPSDASRSSETGSRHGPRNRGRWRQARAEPHVEG